LKPRELAITSPAQQEQTLGEVAHITVYSKPDCHLCADALAALVRLQCELAFTLEERDITTDDALHRAYFERIPVVALDGEELCEYFVDETLVRERLESGR
jgi:glutaredoxin